ncbi:Reticulon-domain-containing protein [Myxozyma melibiosi]|uniref:Reticulon-like protein n=1 Tax=Myxozyma melibiosi TaxID=54550 RepID=A0ABR1F2Q2_9ASCO
MSDAMPIAEPVPVAAQTETPPFDKYKTLISDLLTWKKVAQSGIAFGSLVTALLVFKYVNVVKLVFNAAYIAFGTAVAVEFAGRTIKKSPGFVSSFRTAGGYFVISKNVVEPVFEELLVLLNFGLVEVQKIVFVENTQTTVVAFVASWFVYKMVQHVSVWSLAFAGVIFAFAAPVVYLKFQTEIDAQIESATKVVSAKTDVAKSQVKEQYDKGVSLASGYVSLGLEKVGYKRNMPPVPAATEATPAAAAQ